MALACHDAWVGAQVLDTIFVSVASYRDPECHNTVADLFRQVGPRDTALPAYQPSLRQACSDLPLASCAL